MKGGRTTLLVCSSESELYDLCGTRNFAAIGCFDFVVLIVPSREYDKGMVSFFKKSGRTLSAVRVKFSTAQSQTIWQRTMQVQRCGK